MEKQYLAWLITKRSQVQILLPLPKIPIKCFERSLMSPHSIPTTNAKVTIRPPSGSKPGSIKIKHNPALPYVRPKPSPGKGNQNPPHFHVPFSKSK